MHASRITYHISLVSLSLILLLTLTSCGSGITQTAQTERYTVALTLDSASFGERMDGHLDLCRGTVYESIGDANTKGGSLATVALR